MARLGPTLASLKQRRRFADGTPPVGPTRLKAGEFRPNPGALRMFTYAPEDLRPKAPLVVVLHGCTQTAEGYARAAGWLDLADRFGFVVLCPEQSATNNPNRCFNWFETGDTARGLGEAGSIAAMIEKVIAERALDSRQVFITGLSAGGAMTASMAAAYPEVFAGAAILAGLPHGAATDMTGAFRAMAEPAPLSAGAWGDEVRSASRHAGPWPVVSIWHGDADMTVRPASADALVSQWTDVHGVAGAPTPARTPDGRRFEVWRTPNGDVVVEHHRFERMGHGAPVSSGGGLHGTAGPFLLDVGVASSLEIAMGWGIADVVPAAPHPPRVMPTADPSSTLRDGAPAVSQASDYISQTIEKALRSAGLLP